jgi:dTDP-4-dehydrorhamnose reductase
VTIPLLVTGGTGYLGGELLRRAPAVGTWHSREPTARGDWLRLDVRDEPAVRRELRRLRPATVIHTAYRQDDRAVTLDGAAAVAEAAAAVGARLVHVSSDVIFDGTKPGPYTEQDPPSPITDYGRAKAEAERAVRAAHRDALVVRTSLLYGGSQPSRHERLAHEAADGRGDMTFFENELRSPVLVGELASALLELAAREERGILHVAGSDTVSRYQFACLLARAHGLSGERIRRSRLGGSGPVRPANCALDSSRARALLRVRLHGVLEYSAGRTAAAGGPPP